MMMRFAYWLLKYLPREAVVQIIVSILFTVPLFIACVILKVLPEAFALILFIGFLGYKMSERIRDSLPKRKASDDEVSFG